MSETTPAFDTAEGLYDEIDGLRVMLALRERQLGHVIAAGRAVVAAIIDPTSPDDGYPESGRYCCCCDEWIDADGHTAACPIPGLVAALDGDA
jgi:hypothetical protein